MIWRHRVQKAFRIRYAQGADIIQLVEGTSALRGRLDLMVCHIKMPGEMDGIDLAYSVRQSFPAFPAILISDYAGVEAVKKVAATFDFLPR